MPQRKLTMTTKWRESLAKARAAREAKARERGSRYTPEGMERLRALGKRNAASWDASREWHRARKPEAQADADALLVQLFELIGQSRLLNTEIARKSGVSLNTLRAWRKGSVNPSVIAFRDVAWTLGYVLKLEKFERRPKDKSVWNLSRVGLDLSIR